MADQPAGGKGGGEGPRTGAPLEPNVASVLCYICLPFSSVIFVLMEKQNKDVLFHAWQGTFFGAAIFIVMLVLNLASLVMGRLVHFFGALVDSFIVPVLWLGIVVVWIVCLLKSYQGERWKIPVIGDFAAKKVG